MRPCGLPQIDARVDAYAGPPGFDTAEILRSLRTPTLWLLGSRDESIPIRHTERHLRALVAAGVPITLKVYEGGNQSVRAIGADPVLAGRDQLAAREPDSPVRIRAFSGCKCV